MNNSGFFLFYFIPHFLSIPNRKENSFYERKKKKQNKTIKNENEIIGVLRLRQSVAQDFLSPEANKF